MQPMIRSRYGQVRSGCRGAPPVALPLVVAMALLSGCAWGEGDRSVAAAGDENVVRQAREIAPFTRIRLVRAGRVMLSQGESPSLAVETESRALDRVRTRVVDGVLELEWRAGPLSRSDPPSPLDYHVRVTELDGIAISGAGTIEAERLSLQELAIDVDGSGKVSIDSLSAERLDVAISGSGRFELAGSVHEQQLSVDGSARYLAAGLDSRVARVRVSGSGRIALAASDELDVRISGSGELEYAGDPRITSRISGSGTLRRIDTGDSDRR